MVFSVQFALGWIALSVRARRRPFVFAPIEKYHNTTVTTLGASSRSLAGR
jgi:hypothetical protein